MSVDDRRVVSADNLRDEAIHQAENWLMAFGALIPSDQFQNLAIRLAADLAKPAIETVAAQAEQISAVLALHRSALEDDEQGQPWCAECGGIQPCATARMLGATA